MPFGPELILSAFILFCRIGACLMLMPGFSSAASAGQPTALHCNLLHACPHPLLAPQLQGVGSGAISRRHRADHRQRNADRRADRLHGTPILSGALETLAMAAAMAIGVAANLGAPIDHSEPLPSLVSLISLTATTLFFVSDQHLEVFRGLSASYVALPVAQGFDTRFGLVQVAIASARHFSSRFVSAARSLCFR